RQKPFARLPRLFGKEVLSGPVLEAREQRQGRLGEVSAGGLPSAFILHRHLDLDPVLPCEGILGQEGAPQEGGGCGGCSQAPGAPDQQATTLGSRYQGGGEGTWNVGDLKRTTTPRA